MVRLTKSVRTMAVFAIHFFLAPVFSRPPTAPARLDSFCPQCQFILFVERLQLSCHEPPVSRIVSASCIYNLLLYGSIGTYCECRCKSWDGLTLTHFHLFRLSALNSTGLDVVKVRFIGQRQLYNNGTVKVVPLCIRRKQQANPSRRL